MSDPLFERLADAARLYEEFLERPDRDATGARDAFLAEHEGLRDLLEPMFADGPVATADDYEPIVDHPEHIGPYRVLQPLGRGGFGIVYLADQREPIQRRVAIKVLKRGMDSEEIVARFETERQALAMMHHPGIASVHDAGITEDGRPYFVMEYVAGARITDFCESEGLDLRQRLDVFARVCEAVQHAHQKGVIHRDLKPSNILVDPGGGKPRPKVIDFGVAKSLQPLGPDRSLATRRGQLIGTIEYMSPEQALADVVDIDTRSDIYALGVVLYELLTRRLPFTRDEMESSKSHTSVRDFIRDVDPQRPSVRLRESGGDPRAVRSIHGELDWICLKALEKNRNRRYASAEELGDDVRRFLAGEPVRAVPPSFLYTVGKLVRRHRSAAVLTLVILVAGAVTTGVAAISGFRLKQKNEELQAEMRDRNALVGLLDRMLSTIDPLRRGDPDLPFREVIERGVADLSDEALDRELRPATRDEYRTILAGALNGLGAYERARELIAGGSEVDLSGSVESGEPPSPLEIRRATLLAELRIHLGEWARARDAMLRLEEAVRPIASERPETYARVVQLLAYGRVLVEEPTDELLAWLDARFEEQADRLGRAHPEVLELQHHVVSLYDNRGDVGAAERSLREIVERRERSPDLGPDHWATLQARQSLALLLHSTGRSGEAFEILEDVGEARARVLGERHPDTLWTRAYRAIVRSRIPLDDGDETRARIEEAVDTTARVLDEVETEFFPRHPRVVDLREALIVLLADGSRLAIERAREHERNANSRRFGTPEERAEESRSAEARRADADAWIERAVGAHRTLEASARTDDERRTSDVRGGPVGRVLAELGRWREARPYLGDAVRAMDAEGDTEGPEYLVNVLLLGFALLEEGRYPEACALFEGCLAGREESPAEADLRAKMEDVLRDCRT